MVELNVEVLVINQQIKYRTKVRLPCWYIIGINTGFILLKYGIIQLCIEAGY
jgi:hypothetical protein